MSAEFLQEEGDTLGKQKVLIISIILWFIEDRGRNSK